jgi:Ca2+-binding RTX toxin-like protein
VTARRLLRAGALSAATLVALVVLVGLTATNSVPTTRLDQASRAITPNDLKPAACAALNLTTIVTGSGTINGGNGNSLILGSAGADQIRGKKGDDCLVGGGGNDRLDGDQGVDVCIGGPGTDTFTADCETRIP